ncbi:hypothetical protein [Sorangium sp. So ce176]|uniref:hypothetical protein n=1 Tax=Sorangium sp. So ce176 TaxID=3133286 RepID=UPI003F620119
MSDGTNQRLTRSSLQSCRSRIIALPPARAPRRGVARTARGRERGAPGADPGGR